MCFSRNSNKKRDRATLIHEVNIKEKEMEDRSKLGDRFLSDKEKIEYKMDEIEKSDLPPDKKRQVWEQLREDILKLEGDYEGAVTVPLEKLQKELQSDIYEMEDSIHEMSRAESALRRTKIEVASADMRATASELAAEKVAYEQLRKDTYDYLVENISQREAQERNIRVKRLRR